MLINNPTFKSGPKKQPKDLNKYFIEDETGMVNSAHEKMLNTISHRERQTKTTMRW